MDKGRLEAFSDGVIAILITIMVLELKIPHGADFAALRPNFADLFVLRFEFYLHRNLLEQSPSLIAGDQTHQRQNPLGESASFVLAVADPVCHRLDGRKSFRAAADRHLRRNSACRRHRLLHSAKSDYR